MPQLQRIGRAHTRVFYTDNDGHEIERRLATPRAETHVTYHGKHVVCFNQWYICLRNHGRFTMTTKTRMNQAANQFGLGFLVYQRTINGRQRWFVRWDNMDVDFDGSGMILNRPVDRPAAPAHRPRRSRRAPQVIQLGADRITIGRRLSDRPVAGTREHLREVPRPVEVPDVADHDYDDTPF